MVKLWGIDSINVSNKRKEFVWGEIANLVDFNIIEKYVQTVGLEELLNTFPKMLNAKLDKKILVDVNK